MAHKGRDKESLTVDRVDASRGYELDNIRALTHEANCKRLVEGVTDPAQPIMEALALTAGETNIYKFQKLANEILYKVELIQADVEGGFERPVEDDENYVPF